ncbi:MAG: hypothetical protein JWQ14_2019 [Adhaeribacter sp.]|nr:hypothetical protein [Adhaeribacter sp.]
MNNLIEKPYPCIQLVYEYIACLQMELFLGACTINQNPDIRPCSPGKVLKIHKG